MKPSEPADWRRISPFAVVFFVGKTTRNLVRGYVQLVATFGALAVLIRGTPYAALLIPLALLVIVAIAGLRFWSFRFRIEEDRIVIRQGILKRTSVDLPFHRIQGINVERNPVDRLLGLVTVSLDTAGSETTEGELPCVSRELAEELRRRIGFGDQGRSDERPGVAEGTVPGVPDIDRDRARRKGDRAPGRVLLRLSAGDMFRIGLGRDNILFAMMLIAAAWRRPRELPYRLAETFGFSEDLVRPALETAEATLARTDALGEGTFTGGIVLSALAAVVAVGVGTAFLRYFRFTLWREGTAYRSRGGLLTQNEVVVETAKVQQLTLSQDMLLRMLHRFRLRMHPAADADASEHHDVPRVLEVPLLEAPLAQEMRASVFGEEGEGPILLPKSDDFRTVSPLYIQALALRLAVVPAMAGAILLLPVTGLTKVWATFAGTWAAIWIVCGGLTALQRWRRQGYVYGNDGMAGRSGFVGRRVDAFLYRKAQSVALKRSPIERRNGLATLEVELASDTVTVPYIDQGVARRLRDYILYTVEASRRRWH
ncbi:MAG: PH domain-containing protein [Gemmatimonadetes bacterium]|nr:PH domain-containing protein [Gemmatimonadota bacterium]MYB97671.1 PH domain-containing protein [Gemmatimonadota bacterium]MYI46726.1 PH domain-containing protein [Gemmatimonadota bacterium]